MYCRYTGSFISRKGTEWKVDIMQLAEQPFGKVGELSFPADEPLVIEWEDKEKHEPIVGSMATLKVFSPGDRTYLDLYTIEAASVRLDVYRKTAGGYSLYWNGTMDTEFYEEPYERYSNYVVSMKFNDFGIMDRTKYSLSGMRNFFELINLALEKCGLMQKSVNTEYVSTSFAESISQEPTPEWLDKLYVRSDNFYDEDGEAMTMQEVVEGMLQPLGLRLVQRDGTVYLYDLNFLGADNWQNCRDVRWSGDSQTLSTDRVYNNIKITWSPYAEAENLMPEDCYTGDTPVGVTALNEVDGRILGEQTLYSYRSRMESIWENWSDDSDIGFTLWTQAKGKNAVLVDGDVRFFRVVPQYDGDDDEGVAVSWWSVDNHAERVDNAIAYTFDHEDHGIYPAELAGTVSSAGRTLFRSTEVWLPPVTGIRPMLKLRMELMMDTRFNPYEEPVDYFYGTWWEFKKQQDRIRNNANYVYVPVRLSFRRDGDGKVLVWDNRHVVKRSVKDDQVTTMDTGVWTEDQEAWGYLCYYSKSDRTKDSAISNGWATNRNAINPHSGAVTSYLENLDDGQYIGYPEDYSGTVWIEVLGKGWMIQKAGYDLSAETMSDPGELWGVSSSGKHSIINTIWVKLPQLDMVNPYQFSRKIEVDDIEYSACINEKAKEDLELETIFGTSSTPIATARGAYYFMKSNGTLAQMTYLYRQGVYMGAEKLLINTLYSQYGSRHIRLEGEADILAHGLSAYQEDGMNSASNLMVTADRQDLIKETSEATFVEVTPDEYVPKT